MAEITAGFLGPALQVVKWVGAPILRQFKYLCCFTTNITNLKNEAQKLQDAERDLQLKVDAAKRDVQIIYSEVETWLENSKNIKDEADGILNEVPNVEGGCLKLTARFSLSKRAKKTADRLKELRDQCKFDTETIGQPGPPAAMNLDPSAATLYEFKSRKKIEEDIMATLREGDVNMMGICGMGGLGKTTMAKKIKNRALGEHVFDEVAMVVISRPIDKVKIQDEIGGSLGLKLEGECSEARVQKLHARLSGTTRILLILDDVWERFKPEDLGIPRGYKGCTILLTSRNRDVLNAMKVQKIFGMEVLSKEDSWLLFRMGAGQCVDDTKLNSIAKEVVSECAGLPIVLITVGAALNGEVDVYIWENALQRLKINCPPDIPEYIAEVYKPLKLSYDVLERNYQDVFLLCCLYPEDAHIRLEQLTYFCMGLRLWEGASENVEKAKNRIRALTKVLKNRSLLLDSEKGDEYVRMHDVVRDVCIFIAKQKGYIGDNDLTSSLQRYKLHSGFELLQIRNSRDKEIKFDGIRDLYVLSIERCSKLTSLPFTQRPNNLITLVLDTCYHLETLSVVGKLVNLEILICRNCDSIEELPPEIKGLNRLKVLDLTGCRNLQRIGRGIMSSLVGLEELKMLGSFDQWEGEHREERENAGLRELEALTNLRCLEIEIRDRALAAENIHLYSKVDKFTNSGVISNENNSGGDVEFPSLRKVVTRAAPNMKNFTLGSLAAPNLESFETYLNNYLLQVPFISVKKLSVFGNVKPLNCYQIHGSVFDRLEVLEIRYYQGSMRLFSSSISGNLVNLTTLTIEKCWNMVKVIEEKEEEKEKVVRGAQRTTILFPKLRMIVLYNLPALVRFCEWKCDVELPSLTEVGIYGCDNMKSCTSGLLTTPNLKRVYIHPQDFGAVKDLNAFLQQQYFNRTEKKLAEEAEKKKGGEEEQERKGETEEEQN